MIRQDTHYVYVIELRPSVLARERFAEANPGYRYRHERPPLYVGMTGRTPEIRFAQHKAGYKASRYTRCYCLALRPDLYEHLNPMSHSDAERIEVSLANDLRRLGYAVWQN